MVCRGCVILLGLLCWMKEGVSTTTTEQSTVIGERSSTINVSQTSSFQYSTSFLSTSQGLTIQSSSGTGTFQSTPGITTVQPCVPPCINRGKCDNTTCVCDMYFAGETCEIINMTAVNVSPSSRTVMFDWGRDVRFNNYWFLYTTNENDTSKWETQEVFRWKTERSLLMVHLEPQTGYTICIVSNEYLENITRFNRTISKTSKDMDCVVTKTKDPVGRQYNIIFYVTLAYIIAVPVVLAILRLVTSIRTQKEEEDDKVKTEDELTEQLEMKQPVMQENKELQAEERQEEEQNKGTLTKF